MSELTQTLLAETDLVCGLIGAAFGALVGSLATHRMSRDAATKDRIRAVRTRLRKLIAQASTEDGFGAFSLHREMCPLIFELQHAHYNDVRWWRRRSFGRACEAFLSIPGEALTLRIEPSPTGVARSKESKAKDDEELQRPGKLLADALRAILRKS